MKLRQAKKIIYGRRLPKLEYDAEKGLFYLPDRSKNPQVRKAIERLKHYYKNQNNGKEGI